MKRGRLGKDEMSYISNNLDKTPKEIADFLDRNEDTVINYINSINPKEKPSTLFERSMGRVKTATVLTKNASDIAETIRKPRARYTSECIHKIK